MKSKQESEPSQTRVLTIQKSPQRAFRHLKILGRAAGVTIFSSLFYLLYWGDSSIRRQYETLFWWLALIFGVVTVWRSESSHSRASTTPGSPQRAFHPLKTLGKIAGFVIGSVIVDLVFLKNIPMAEQTERYLRWFTLIFAAFAIWFLIRDWLATRDMTFVFDSNRQVFSVTGKDGNGFQLGLQAIKRIKIVESSNLFPVYSLFIHLQDGQVIEIDNSADQKEISELANQLSEMTGAQIVIRHYNEHPSQEEKEQMWRRDEVYKGD